MGRLVGSRALLGVSTALMLLLGVLAAVQYQWSTRVAAADAQREKEHLDAAASLFATRFNAIAGRAAEFLQEQAQTAARSKKPLQNVPRLIGELFYVNSSADEMSRVLRLSPEGRFVSSAPPDWFPNIHCGAQMKRDPLVLVSPVFDIDSRETKTPDGIRILKRFSRIPDRCFVARMDDEYLRASLFPELIRDSFGVTAVRDYDFAVVPRDNAQSAIYGAALTPDVRKNFFFLLGPTALPLPNGLPPRDARRSTTIFFQHEESIVDGQGSHFWSTLGPGAWELQVAHKGMPLAAAFEQTRRQNLLLSLGVEALVLVAVAFLVISARRVQQLAERKIRFVAGVSHELRTPVSAISMLSRNQADGLVTGADKVKQYGELIHQQSQRLNAMVEQTLEYAGIHSGLRRPAKNDIDLRGLIDEAVDARREELARGGFELQMDISPDLPPVLGDAKLLRTAFDNLLDNAQKYAGSGRWIRVSARHVPGGKEIQISVEDRGAGIDAADQSEIFEPFCRGKSAIEAQIPGSGLGLSLVRSAAEAHRGSVTLASEPGRGSTFTLHLPV